MGCHERSHAVLVWQVKPPLVCGEQVDSVFYDSMRYVEAMQTPMASEVEARMMRPFAKVRLGCRVPACAAACCACFSAVAGSASGTRCTWFDCLRADTGCTACEFLYV